MRRSIPSRSAMVGTSEGRSSDRSGREMDTNEPNQIRLMGPIAAVWSGCAVDLGGAKQQTIVAALALAPGAAIGPDRLIDLLWDDEPPRTARRTLQSYSASLRRAWGDSCPLGHTRRLPPRSLPSARRPARLRRRRSHRVDPSAPRRRRDARDGAADLADTFRHAPPLIADRCPRSSLRGVAVAGDRRPRHRPDRRWTRG